MTNELVLAALFAAQAVAGPTQPIPLERGDAVVVTSDLESIRGRIAAITADSIVLEGGHMRLPIATVLQIDRTGDSTWNGAAIGAAVGGGVALAGMAIACRDCADTSANLDPRITLVGALAGAGIGALIDKAIERRTTIYTAAAGAQTMTTPRPAQRTRATAFVRVGAAGLWDDEGSLGNGATIGAGVVVPIRRRFGLQIAYDRHDHRREFESAAPPGVVVPIGGFTGTEQLVTAKMLMFFRVDNAVRPYAGIGVGLLDSSRTSEFPNYSIAPGGGIAGGTIDPVPVRLARARPRIRYRVRCAGHRSVVDSRRYPRWT